MSDVQENGTPLACPRLTDAEVSASLDGVPVVTLPARQRRYPNEYVAELLRGNAGEYLRSVDSAVTQLLRFYPLASSDWMAVLIAYTHRVSWDYAMSRVQAQLGMLAKCPVHRVVFAERRRKGVL